MGEGSVRPTGTWDLRTGHQHGLTGVSSFPAEVPSSPPPPMENFLFLGLLA